MNRGTKRQKGGAEKKREKIKKALLSEGEKCAKLDSFFQNPATSTSNSSIDVNDTGEPAEEEYVQEEQNEQEGNEQDMVDNELMELAVATNTEQQAPRGSDCGLDEATEMAINAAGGSVATVSVSTSEYEINYFSRPNSNTLNLFFKFHPNQLADNATIRKAFSRKDGSLRRWVSYSAEKHSLFCAVCLAFSKKNRGKSFHKWMQ